MRSRTATLTLSLAALGLPLITTAAYRSGASPMRSLTVTANDFTFEAPDTVFAGATTIHLINHGAEAHHVWLGRIEGGKTMADAMALLQSRPGAEPPSWLISVGGPNAAMPGAETVTSVPLKAGNYVMLCFIPTRGGQPHMMKGMVRSLTVVPASDVSLNLPKGDVTARMTEYAYTFSRPLKAGHHPIRVHNAGTKLHELVLVKLNPGKTMKDFVAWTDKVEGPPPGTTLGGVTGIAPGIDNVMDVTLQPGEYGLVCFVVNPGEKKPHFMLGMMQQFTIRS